ncbi:D-2-hydroxyacid dehydrogenase [Defluviimonas sp. WL0002]|uniref:D-2-hydroxyacid dehydrogenase n=1 Tax=Albidovulum marisflavi TaxID=2984159 RepID=A0ABT2ZBG5_9RHOB|nr:D-2-hydroxyacid dehydrogenase [Defluviimonas sp. WL0002]MCV2868413.1 D-2-hydroxyacid dehydrogenase [Defluviimonas sp. WL0002]
MKHGKPVVLLHTDLPDAARSIVVSHHPDLTIATCESYDGLSAALAESGADVVYSVRFGGGPGFPRAALVESPKVRWVSVGGSGCDHLMPWKPEHVTVTNAAGVAADMMAEYVLGTALAFSLDLKGFARAQAERRWIDGRVTPIGGRTLLVLGLGKTGQAAAMRAKAMGMSVLGVRARPQPTPNFDEVHGLDALSRLWPRADFILVCVPLLPSTRGLVDAAAFGAMKTGAVLIDVSRGGVCDEAALIEALRTGRLKGAALDVFAQEPLPQESPLWAMENVILTPHCSSVYDGWAEKSVKMFCENLKRYRSGEALTNVVDPVRGY